LSNFNDISQAELIRLYWEKIKSGTLTHAASYERLGALIRTAKKRGKHVPRVIKLIEQEIKWKKK